MKNASGKRPPDEAHGPGKEAIRPQQRCLGKSRKEGAHGRAAPPEEVLSKDYAVSKDKARDARQAPLRIQKFC